jgi:hypothetical protein
MPPELGAVLAQAEAAAPSTESASPEYALSFPEGFKAPADHKFDENDPRLPTARALARELGMTQAEFSRALALDHRLQVEEMARYEAEHASETKKLGDNAKDRLGALEKAIRAALQGDDKVKQSKFNGLAGFATSAAAVEALEDLAGIKRAVANAGGGSPRSTPMADRWYGK